MKASYFGLLDR